VTARRGEAWIVAYTDQGGKRRIKSFDRKRDADAYQASIATDLKSGIHVSDCFGCGEIALRPSPSDGRRGDSAARFVWRHRQTLAAPRARTRLPWAACPRMTTSAQPALYFGTQRARWPHTCPTPQSQSFLQPFGCSGGASTT
jgi:hypothetical protein